MPRNTRLNLPPLATRSDGTIAPGLLEHFARTLRDWSRRIDTGQVVTGDIADKAVTGPKMQPALCQQTRLAISFGDNVLTLVPFNSVSHTDLDPLGWHDPAVNPARITPNIAGWYRVFCATGPLDNNDYANLRFDIEKNGTVVRRDHPAAASGARTGITASTPLIQMNGSTDYLQIRFAQNNTANVSRNVDITFGVELVYPT